jgi:dTMP kinase
VPVRGRLIALEGIDGSGKSTQARAVAAALGAHLTFEPGATPAGAELRRLLLAPEGPALSRRAEALLMLADRAEHVASVIEPALAGGAWVVTDRYADSTLAYQGYGQGLSLAGLADLVAWATAGVAADLAVLVDVPVEVAAARLEAATRAGGADRLERLGADFATRVREGFLALAAAEPSRWLVVDGRAEAAVVTARIVACVRERFGDPPEPMPAVS